MKTPKVIPLKQGAANQREIDYGRKHDITIEEMRASPLFNTLSDDQIQEVIEIYKEFCLVSLEIIDNQYFMNKNEQNKSHIARTKKTKTIQLNPSKDQAA